jgi:hypothetical protein
MQTLAYQDEDHPDVAGAHSSLLLLEKGVALTPPKLKPPSVEPTSTTFENV